MEGALRVRAHGLGPQRCCSSSRRPWAPWAASGLWKRAHCPGRGASLAALDIQGGKSTDGTATNARVVAAARKAGASSAPYDEVNHVHCEFFGIQAPSGGAE